MLYNWLKIPAVKSLTHRALCLALEEERVGVGVVVRDDDGGRLVKGDRVLQ